MPKGRYWLFVINNPSEDEYPTFDPRTTQYMVYQLERGHDRDTPHLQGCLSTIRQATNTTIKEIIGTIRAHVELSRSDAIIAYCIKEDTRVAGPWEFGIRPSGNKPGERTDLIEVGAAIAAGDDEKKVANTFPTAYIKYSRGIRDIIGLNLPRRDRNQPTTVIYLWGPTGTGKTKWAWEQYPGLYAKAPDTKWWDGYKGEGTVLIDDIDKTTLSKQITYWLKVLDRYPMRVEVKGSTVELVAHHFVLTSNESTDEICENLTDAHKRAFIRRIDSTIETPANHQHVYEM